MSSLATAAHRLVLVLAAGASFTACAGVPGDQPSQADLVARGRNLAMTECSQCHAVGSGGGHPATGAPSFESIAERYRNTRIDWQLETISQVGHYEMPRKQLTSVDIEELAAYIRSLDRAPR